MVTVIILTLQRDGLIRFAGIVFKAMVLQCLI